MGYVASGEFEKDLTDVFGPLEKKKKEDVENKTFEQFKPELCEELNAAYALWQNHKMPDIGGLSWSYFFSIAEQYDADEEELRDEYDMEDEDEIKLLMNTVEVFDNSGAPFFTVGDAGVCLAYDGPFEIEVVHESFETFLKFLVQLSAAAEGKTPLADVQKTFANEFKTFENQLFLEKAIEQAKAKGADQAFEAGLDAGGETFDPTGVTFLFTGKLASMTRAEAQKRVTAIGGENAKSVNKKLGVLVIGDDGSPLYGEGTKGSKHKKADQLIADGSSLRIISESDFLKL